MQGFGLDRLDALVNSTPPMTPAEILVEGDREHHRQRLSARPERRRAVICASCCAKLWVIGGPLDHPYFRAEAARQQRLRDRYARLKLHHPDKPPEW